MNQSEKPDYVGALEAVYGPPSQAGFGSAVFAGQMGAEDDLEERAKQAYQEFVGEKWEKWGEETWLAPWREVYARPEGADGDIFAGLQAIEDPSVSASALMILDVVEDAEAGRQALSAAFDAPEVQQVRVYNIGDGEAMSGLIVAGRRDSGEATVLVFLLD